VTSSSKRGRALRAVSAVILQMAAFVAAFCLMLVCDHLPGHRPQFGPPMPTLEEACEAKGGVEIKVAGGWQCVRLEVVK
jgi:hypothetical protein